MYTLEEKLGIISKHFYKVLKVPVLEFVFLTELLSIQQRSPKKSLGTALAFSHTSKFVSRLYFWIANNDPQYISRKNNFFNLDLLRILYKI